MEKEKEHNFISAVVYVDRKNASAKTFLEGLQAVLEAHFRQYEIIIVAEKDHINTDPAALRRWAGTIGKPVTFMHMAACQSLEQCMNAGLDIAIGDYVYEFDAADPALDMDLVWTAYASAMEGHDIVTVCPKNERFLSRAFYKIFKAYSGYSLRTNIFRLLSRRAINRAHAMNQNMPYRKATYATCGLSEKEIEVAGVSTAKQEGQVELAVDSLTLYTNFGYKFSLRLALGMMIFSLLEIIYTVSIYFRGDPVAGWASLVCIYVFGLTGVFALFALTLKYLALILRICFKKQSYLVESIDKL